MMAASPPTPRTFDLSAGSFRALEWPGSGAASVVFLHGLSGMAEVWSETVTALGPNRPRCLALDQRGHGHSPRATGRYAASDYLGDLLEFMEHLDGPVHLVGHSMGARVAILAGARHGERFTSVTIVDIGPEAWRANIAATTAAISALPHTFADRNEAVALLGVSGRDTARIDRFIERRLRREHDGSYTWLADLDGLIESVSIQRARDYWRDWDRIHLPALLVRGGTSREVRPRIADEMLRRNPGVRSVEVPETGHNIPLLAPEALADALAVFWGTLSNQPAL